MTRLPNECQSASLLSRIPAAGSESACGGWSLSGGSHATRQKIAKVKSSRKNIRKKILLKNNKQSWQGRGQGRGQGTGAEAAFLGNHADVE